MIAQMSKSALRHTLRVALLGAAALVASLAAPSSAHAQSAFNTTLDTLTSGGTNQNGITLGDKRYSNFTFSSSGDAPIGVNAVNVSLTASGNQHNLRFSFEREALAAVGGQTTDVVICYQIDVLGNQQINGVGLAFDSAVGAGSPGLAAASVVETISRVAPLGTDVGQISVFNDGTGALPDSSRSTLIVDPTATTLYFCKDILVSSRPQGGTVSISTVDNFVTQVPEPASMAALALVGGALMARRRRGA
jgi:hypothetical protein